MEVPTGAHGQPVEAFLVDPPHRLDTAALGLSPVGVKLIPRRRPDGSTVYDVFDWIGSEHYPNVADFVEEARRFGISRRIAATASFECLTPDSRLMLLHSRAWIKDSPSYLTERRRACPKGLPAHALDAPWPPMCAALWWEDIEGGYTPEDAYGPREVFRAFPPQRPQFRYQGASRPDHVERPQYAPAIFAVFPLMRIGVVRDRAGGKHEATAERARQSQLPVEVQDE